MANENDAPDNEMKKSDDECKNIQNKEDKENDFSNKSNDDNRYSYSKDELMAISKIVVCKKRPRCLDSCYNNSRGLWDPLPWSNVKICPNGQQSATNASSKGGSIGNANGSQKWDRSMGTDNDKDGPYKRRTDPRERIKDESLDDIVLSPQRRSFGTGCHIVPNKPEPTANRAARGENQIHHHDKSSRDDRDHMMHREPLPRGRVGSGRIMERRNQNDWSRPSRDHRDDDMMDNRRSNQRDFSRNYDYDNRWSSMSSRNRYHSNSESRHDSHSYEDEEPEWFSAGPTSQHDTIELRGFDEDDRTEDDRNEEPPPSRQNKSEHHETREQTSQLNSNSNNNHGFEKQEADQTNVWTSQDNHANHKDSQDFDINEIFRSIENDHMASSIPVADGPQTGENQSGTSRFAQWFSENREIVEDPIDKLLRYQRKVRGLNSNKWPQQQQQQQQPSRPIPRTLPSPLSLLNTATTNTTATTSSDKRLPTTNEKRPAQLYFGLTPTAVLQRNRQALLQNQVNIQFKPEMKVPQFPWPNMNLGRPPFQPFDHPEMFQRPLAPMANAHIRQQQHHVANNVPNNFYTNQPQEQDLVNLLQKANINVNLNQLRQIQPSLPSIRYEQAKSLEEIEAGYVRSPHPSESEFSENPCPRENLNQLLFRLQRQ